MAEQLPQLPSIEPLPLRPAAAEAERQYILMQVGPERFAAEITEVQEVLRRFKRIPIPGAPEYVLGVVNLRGQVVTVLCGRKVLGAESENPAPNPRVLVLDLGEEILGLSVDAVPGVVRLSEEQIEPPLADDIRLKEAVVGLCRLDGDRVATVLNLRKALPKPPASSLLPE